MNHNVVCDVCMKRLDVEIIHGSLLRDLPDCGDPDRNSPAAVCLVDAVASLQVPGLHEIFVYCRNSWSDCSDVKRVPVGYFQV